MWLFLTSCRFGLTRSAHDEDEKAQQPGADWVLVYRGFLKRRERKFARIKYLSFPGENTLLCYGLPTHRGLDHVAPVADVL